MNKPKTHDNRAVSEFLADYLTPGELCEAMPRADDILTGVLQAQTPGSTSTRTPSRQVLFGILQGCQHISTEAVRQWTLHRGYSETTVKDYTGRARLASKALAYLLGRSLHPDCIEKPT